MAELTLSCLFGCCKPASGHTVRDASGRVTTCLENLEMLGNLTAVMEMSGILLKIRENILLGKSSL